MNKASINHNIFAMSDKLLSGIRLCQVRQQGERVQRHSGAQRHQDRRRPQLSQVQLGKGDPRHEHGQRSDGGDGGNGRGAPGERLRSRVCPRRRGCRGRCGCCGCLLPGLPSSTLYTDGSNSAFMTPKSFHSFLSLAATAPAPCCRATADAVAPDAVLPRADGSSGPGPLRGTTGGQAAGYM